MAAPPELDDVMAFLNSRGFSAAADALRAELLPLDDVARPFLAPLRLTPSRGAADDVAPSTISSLSSSSEDFVSMGSSPFELLNPTGVWSPVRARSEESMSSRYSEFGTAREDNNFWFGDNFGGYYNDPFVGKDNSGQFRSEDKFITSTDVDEQFQKQENFSFGIAGHDHRGGAHAGCDEIYNRPFPICDCCRQSENKSNVEVANLFRSPSSAAIYGRYQILDDHTERLDEYALSNSQLIRTNLSESITHKGSPFQNSSELNDRGSSFWVPVEKELLMLNDSTPYTGSYTNCNTVYESKVTKNSQNTDVTSLHKISNHELPNVDYFMKPYPEKAIQSFSVNSNGPRDVHITEMVMKDSKAADIEEEDAGDDKVQFCNAIDDELEVFELRIIHRKNRTGFEENKDFPIILNSVIAARYCITEYLGSAAFSSVAQAHDIVTGMDVCLKIIKNDKEFFDQSLDEIKLLKFVNKCDPDDQHHLLRLYDYFYHQEHLFIVTELLRANLYEFQKFNRESGSEEYFTLPRIQVIARQVLEALDYLHGLRIVHCDLKPENILIKSYSRCEIKVIDLGSSCFETDRLCLYVQSRSYRAPEVILGLPYDQKIDMWSLGCILAELYTGDVLFPNDSVPMILARMIGILGPIDMEMLALGQETSKYFTEDYDLFHTNEETGQLEYLIPEKSSLLQHLQAPDAFFLDFLSFLLQTNPRRRPTASEALQHQWLSFPY